MKKIYRILSALICVALLIPSLATTVLAASAGVDTKAVAPSAPEELDALSEYLHASVSTEDNTSHLPVNVHTYYDSAKEYTPNTIGVAGSVSILYVMNTNTERLGTKSDAELVQSFLDRGYFVIVLDYMNNPDANGTALDWSTQDIRCQVIGGSPFTGGKGYTSGTYTDGKLAGTDPNCALSYILPAGYDIAYNIPYFSYDKHGTAGTFELIVEIWNNDFKSVKRNTIVKWVDENGLPRLDLTDAITEKAQTDTSNVDYATWFKTADGKSAISQSQLEQLSAEEQKQYQYTYIGNTIVKEVTDCVQPDGTLIDLNLYCDIIYPSDYDGQLPTMITMASSYTRASSWTAETRPYLNGPLFNGYVGVVSDYGLVPMCRNDHYGYFCGDSQLNSISGDNGTYSLSYYNGIHSDTALLRMLRKIGVDGMDVENYGYVSAPINPEKIGAYGNSKGGVIVRLANPTPEKLQELRCFEAHNGETRLEAFEQGYPYVDHYLDENGNTTDSRIAAPEEQPVLTYSNGKTIHSGLNFVFANCGGASNTLVEGSAPIFGVGTQAGKAEGSYYTYYATTANLARNLDIPFFGLVAPTIAHDLGYGLDKDYGIDILGAFNTYANYWLKDDSPECIIIDVDTTNDICAAADVEIDNVYEISPESSIKLQFTGSIPEHEIEKVTITNIATGEELRGEWHGSYGNQQWQFIPYDIKDSAYYAIVVPNSICGSNGQYLKETVTHTFRTTNGITEDAVSVTLPNVNIASYDCVNRGFTFGAAGYTLYSGVKFNAFKGTGYGLQLDLSAINDENGNNDNQNTRLPIFDEIWADSKYIGQTITFTFEAKASEAGWIKLALNQHGNGNYVWGDGWGLISSRTDLTTEWQTYTYSFVVTEEMFAARANSTSSTPDIALGVRFSGFKDENGKYTDAIINFRNFQTSYTPKATDRGLDSVNDTLFFNFAKKDYSTAHNIDLRFAVTNDAINTVGVYAVNGGSIGEKLGEVTVVGYGIYNFDVTNYVKSCTDAPSVAIKIEETVGSVVLKDFDCENGSTGIGVNALAKYVITDEVSNADGSENSSIKIEYGIRSAYYIDLDGNLVSKYTGSLYQVAASTNGFKGGAFNESDYGKRYRVTFRVYDETSRLFYVFNGDGYSFDDEIADFGGSNYSFYTKAGEWTTVTIEFTVNDDIYYNEVIRSHVFFLYAENKSTAILDPDVAVNVRQMAAATTKPGNYAGKPGLNDSYTVYSNANAVADAGKVTYYEDFSSALYIDDVVFEEVTTSVDIASTAPMLSITPTTTENVLPLVSSSVLSTDPNNAQSGLWISGGQEGFDTKSVKSYVKLSLDGYYGGFSAFVFNAKSEGTANVSVYAVADVNAGQSWTPATITSATAPANDIYASGVNLNAVYGNKALAAFAVTTSSKSCMVELTEFTEYMLEQGAREITLILVSDAKNVTTIEIPNGETVTQVDYFDCVNKGFSVSASGYTLDQSTYKFNAFKGTGNGLQIDLRAIGAASGVNSNQNARFPIFDAIWADSKYIGQTIRFSFQAKASEAGSIKLSLNQHGNADKYVWGDGWQLISSQTDLTTEWQTFTYEFVVTEELFNAKNNSTSSVPNVALGVRFTGFIDANNKYKAAQINFCNFAVSTVTTSDESNPYRLVYNFESTKPTVDTRGYGKQLATIENGELKIDLTKDSQAPNANAYTRVVALDDLFANESNKGKTFVITFKAKASEAGVMDFAFNKYGSFNTYTYGSRTYNAQYALTTEYQTFTYTFVAVDDMFTTHASTNLNLAFRLYNGFGGSTGAYKAAQVYIDDIVISENPYVRSADYTYDFSTTKPTFDTRGYGKQLASIINGELQIDLTKDSQAPNANAYTRVEALDEILLNSGNVGKTFIITFKAKATQAGRLDFAFNKSGSFTTYSYGGTTYNAQYQMTTEYQTFTFTFTVTEDMITTHASTALNLAFRLYNGFGGATGTYYAAQAYIDDLRIYEDLVVKRPTIDVTGTQAVSGSGNSDTLTVYADNSATGAPKIQKTYLSYDLSTVTKSYNAGLIVNISGSNGETVRVYLISSATLTTPVTYANAPVPTGAPIASFVAVNGVNYVDISEAIAENAGKNVVIVLTIEEPSGQVQITATPTLQLANEYHNYTSESQKHTAVAPTYTTVGHIEFYTCEGCDMLYVKNGDQFVEVSVEDVIIPALECTAHNYVDGTCTNCGREEAHVCAGGTATCENKAVCSTCGKEYGQLAPHTSVVVPGKAPTCTETGLTDAEKCAVCGVTTVAQSVLPALGHTEGTPVTENNVAPDCANAGGYDTVVYCTVCSTELSRVHTDVSALGHTEETIPGKAPTCTETGLTEGKKCTTCGIVTVAQVIVDTLGHTEGTPVTENNVTPDCANAGGYDTVVYCTVCSAEVSRVHTDLSALGHTEEILPDKAPTCTETGLSEGKQCTVCGTIILAQTEVPALGHTEEILPDKAPTCTETGLSEGKQCTVCGTIILAQTEVPALGHTEGTPVTENNVAPDCTNAGGYDTVVYCTVCSVELSRVHTDLSALGHTEEILPDKAPTCTETGLSEGKQCTVCGTIILAQTEVPALGHTEGTPVTENSVAPDCTNVGGYDTVVYCAVCSAELSRVHTDLSALGHTEETLPAKAPTCTETGLTAGKKCTVCGTVTVAQTELPANGHTDADPKDYTCDVCGSDLCTEHVEETIPAKAPTCTETGLTEGKKCSICGDIIVAQTEVSALGHTEGTPVTENSVAPDCVNVGGYDTVVYCTVCSAELSRVHTELSALGHTEGTPIKENNVDPTCTEKGGYDMVTYCTVCGTELSRIHTELYAPHTEGTPVKENNVDPTCTERGSYDTVIYCTVCGTELGRTHTELSALGHTEETLPGKAPTCTETGLTEGKKCTACGVITVAQEEIPINGHNYETIVHEPTCVEPGYTTYVCLACGYYYADDTVDANGHTWTDATTEAPKTCQVCGATEGEKLPESTPETDPTPDEEKEEVEELSAFERFWRMIFNFIRRLLGLPEVGLEVEAAPAENASDLIKEENNN